LIFFRHSASIGLLKVDLVGEGIGSAWRSFSNRMSSGASEESAELKASKLAEFLSPVRNC
jgi:hypothetical protein